MDSFQIALDDAAYSHGSDHALGTQWMPPLGEIEAGNFKRQTLTLGALPTVLL